MDRNSGSIRGTGRPHLRRVAVLLLVGAVGGVAALASLGVPVRVAAPIGVVAAGLVVLRVARRPGLVGFAAGLAGVTGGLLALVPALSAVTGLNGCAAFAVLVAVLTAGLYGAPRVMGRMRGVAGAAARRRLAAARGWLYLPEATVAVPGPRSVPMLKSVPAGAVSTTGTDVVFARVHGRQAVVFDRLRPGGRPAEGRQTVWLVRLPLSLPFVSSEIFHGAAERHTDDVSFASALVTFAGSAAPGLPRRWWIEGEWLATADEGTAPRGAAPAEVDWTLHQLAAFAARTDWSRLDQFAT